MNNIISITKETSLDLSPRTGGKGAGLIRLCGAGATVPKSIVIPAGVEGGEAVDEALNYFSDPDAEGLYALRSSASVEDGSEKSYAGQFESYLRISGKDDILKALDDCRLSGQSDRVIAYGDDDEGVPVNVVMQEMVEADFAGVLFTCDPVTGSLNHVVIEAVPGTGENLVGGSVVGERYVFDREGQFVGNFKSDFLDVKTLSNLVREAVATEEKLVSREDDDLKAPLDFEWAVKSGEIIWLQVRPVTAIGHAGGENEKVFLIKPGEVVRAEKGEVHWTTMNAREALPGVITPLMAEITSQIVIDGFITSFKLLGADLSSIKSFDTVGIINGRAYLNITALEDLTALLPLENPEILVNQILMGDRTEEPKLKFSLKVIGNLFKMILGDLTLSSRLKKLEADEYAEWTYPKDGELEALEDNALLKRIEEARNADTAFSVHVSGSMKYMSAWSFLDKFCQKRGGDPSGMIQGTGSLPFARSAAELKGLAYELKDVSQKLYDKNSIPFEDWKKRLDEEPELAEFKEHFKKFIDDFGHLGDASMNLYGDSWRDDPGIVLKMIGNILKSGNPVSREDYLKGLTQRRNEIVEEFESKLGFADRLKFRFLLKMMYQAAPFRENVKFIMYRRLIVMKYFILEVGRRFVERGIIERPSDIFFLKGDVIKETISSDGNGSQKERIEKEKAEYLRFATLPVPIHRIEGPEGVRLYYPAPAGDGEEFHGTGASAGKAVGRARVILNLSESNRLQPGEILVTMTTDPSWTPLFSVAGAVVVEVGSMLSHGAVVAREAGIPAVLGLPGIVGAIKDGDTLIVDGSKGTVIKGDPSE